MKPTFTQRFTDWLKLARIGNTAIIGFSSIVGLIVGGYGSLNNEYYRLILVGLVPALIGAGGNIVNDYFDRFIDAVNKPWRPIPSGRINARTALIVSILLMVIGVLLSILLDYYCFLVAVIASILLFEYSRWIKKTGFPGNIVIALLSLLSILFGGLASPNPSASLLPGLYAFLIILGREVFKGIEDLEGDKKYNVETLAVVAGPKIAFLFGSTLLLIVVIISPIPYLFYKYNIYYLLTALIGVDLPVITSILLVAHDYKHAWRATRILKIPLFTGLLAFLIGVF